MKIFVDSDDFSEIQVTDQLAFRPPPDCGRFMPLEDDAKVASQPR